MRTAPESPTTGALLLAEPQSIIVQMNARFELHVGARMKFVPDVEREGNNMSFLLFAQLYRDQSCVVIGFPAPPTKVLPASEEEPDDAESELFSMYQAAELKYPLIRVQFENGGWQDVRSYHFLALDVRNDLKCS